MITKRVHALSDRQFLIENCDSRTGEYFVGMCDLDDYAPSNVDLRAHAFSLLLAAWLCGGSVSDHPGGDGNRCPAGWGGVEDVLMLRELAKKELAVWTKSQPPPHRLTYGRVTEFAIHFAELERDRIAKFAAAEAKYWEDAGAGDISIGGVAAASNICAAAVAPGKLVGRKYDPETNTITDDPEGIS